MRTPLSNPDQFPQAAIEKARTGLREGGIPIGSVLVCEGEIIGRGHNQRVQKGSVIHHAEMNCLENAGRQRAAVYQRSTIYSTLSPCPMCSGTIILFSYESEAKQRSVRRMSASSLAARGNGTQRRECTKTLASFVERAIGRG